MARGWWQRPCRGYGDEAAPRVYDRPPPRGHSPPPWLFRDGYTNRDPRGWCSGRNGGSSSPNTASFITKVRSPPSFSTEITCRLVSLSSKDFSISFSLSPYLFLCIFFFLLLSSSSFFLSRMTQGTGSRHTTRNSSGFIHENTYFFFSFILVYFFLSFFIFFHVLFSRNFKTEWGTFLFSWYGEYTHKFLSKILLLMKIC